MRCYYIVKIIKFGAVPRNRESTKMIDYVNLHRVDSASRIKMII